MNYIIKFWTSITQLFYSLIKETSIARHFTHWFYCLRSGPLHRKVRWYFGIDITLGLISLGLFSYFTNPYTNYFMHSAEHVVHQLRVLLHSLKNDPIGLKLNGELNKFFLEAFMYHIDLWATFLNLLSPAINCLVIPLTIFGILGLSFQLAMLCDLIVIVSLHAHCFYIYAAILFRMEIIGIKTLWNIIVGRRKNVLKGRIESYDYSNLQLYLATIFFAALLFSLPTVLIYYVVFASLRFCIFLVTYLLVLIQNQLIIIPKDVVTNNCDSKLNDNDKNNMDILNTHHREMLTIYQFFCGLLNGQVMGFTQPIIYYTKPKKI